LNLSSTNAEFTSISREHIMDKAGSANSSVVVTQLNPGGDGGVLNKMPASSTSDQPVAKATPRYLGEGKTYNAANKTTTAFDDLPVRAQKAEGSASQARSSSARQSKRNGVELNANGEGIWWEGGKTNAFDKKGEHTVRPGRTERSGSAAQTSGASESPRSSIEKNKKGEGIRYNAATNETNAFDCSPPKKGSDGAAADAAGGVLGLSGGGGGGLSGGGGLLGGLLNFAVGLIPGVGPLLATAKKFLG
jgi:hypothetical protein